MEITEVRVKLMEERGNERLRAFVTVIFDDELVVRDFKLIEGPHGLFVSCPARPMTINCPEEACRGKNPALAHYCGSCGKKLPRDRVPKEVCWKCGGRGCGACWGTGERTKLYSDISHPIDGVFRARLERAVVDAYRRELDLSREAGYAPRYFEAERLVRMAPDDRLMGCVSGSSR